MPVVAIILGVYLLFVAGMGNSESFVKQLKESKGFIPWIIALGVLVALANNRETAPAGKPFLMLALLALALTQYQNIADQFKKFWAVLK